MTEVGVGVVEDTEAEDMVVVVVVEVVVDDDVVEGAMLITHIHVRIFCKPCRPMDNPLLATK